MPDSNAETIELLKSINTKLGRQNFDFDSLTPYEQEIYKLAAINKASLAEIYDVTENDPAFVEMRKQKEQTDKRYRVDAAMRIIDEDKTLELAAQVSADALKKNKKVLGL